MELTVACVQLNSGADMQKNIADAGALVKQAASAGAQLIALPENAFLMEEPGGGKRQLFHLNDHPGVLAASDWARECSAHVLIGSVAVLDGQDLPYNRSLLIGPQGTIISAYDKIHLFDVELPGGERYAESARMSAGSKAVLAHTPWGHIGMTVCYDVRFPQLYRALAKGGATMLSIPAAFTATTGAAHWHTLLRARAIEHGCFVIAPAQCGTHPDNRKTYGHSLIIDPWGVILAERTEDTPGIITATLKLEEVQHVRAQIPSLRHDRPFQPQ